MYPDLTVSQLLLGLLVSWLLIAHIVTLYMALDSVEDDEYKHAAIYASVAVACLAVAIMSGVEAFKNGVIT